MARQITPSSSIQPSPSQTPSDFVDYQPRRSRSLFGHILTILLQPGYFFRTFPNSRQWVLIAIIVLVLASVDAVRVSQIETQPEGGATRGDVLSGDPLAGSGAPGGAIVGGGGGGGAIITGPGIGGGFDPGVVPPEGLSSGGEGAEADSAEIREITLTAITSGAAVVLAWFIQAILLSEVSLFKGQAPSLGKNLQIAVWATIPLVLMVVIRLIYISAGGETGEMGLVALLEEWEGYASLSPFLQNVIFVLLSNLTLFWLWNALLLYSGGRFALQGNGFVAFLVVVQWIVLAVVLPVVTGAVVAPALAAAGV
jgi:hypothetical protein